jgi:hypothetical protein
MSEITYSSSEELKRYAAQQGLRLPTEEAISNPEVPLTREQDADIPDQIPDEFKGQYLAEMDKRYGHLGYVMPLEDYKKYKGFMDEKKVGMWKTIGEAVGATTTDLTTGAWELTKDVATLKVPKVIGSGIEGAAVGTKNWLYMYEQAKYDKNSWLSKMLFNNHSTIEDEYLSYQEALKVRQMIHKDQNEGVILPPTINVGGMDLDLTNPAVVQAVSYVADPSWLIPNLGVEAAIAKGLRGATAAIGLGENLTKASAFALKKASEGFGKLGDGGEWISSKIAKVDKGVGEVMSDMTGHQHHITAQGKIQGNEGLVRSAESGLGVNQVTIPAWAKVTMVWGGAKLVEGVGRLGETALKLAAEEPKIAGMALSERVALESTNKSIQKVATFWSQNASPFVQWATNTTKVGLHSSMYGGAFGFAFGGEEGLYHGMGTGFVIGSAFNQIGVLHNTVSGGDAVRDTVKQFLWATSHYDFHNQEGLMRLLNNVNQEGGTQAQLSVMSKIAAAERLLPDDPIRILTEKKIKEMSTSAEFDAYERQNLANPEFGGITFVKDKDGKSVILINADRAAKSAVSEETFHGLLLTKRYGKAFSKHAMDALVGTEGNLGALYRMPKDKAVSLLEQFRDQYFNLDKETGGHTPENMSGMYKKFNEAIEQFKGGEKPTEFNAFFEEFLASYWNRFIEDKPLDYLLKGGDLGLVRNAIQGAKDFYRNTMAKDLQEAGVQLVKGDTPDMFLIDQNTKQRVRIPMLEKLMKHYVKELGSGMYDGWSLNNKKYADTHTLLNSDFDHLIKTDIESGSSVKKTEAEVNREMSARIAGLADELMALPKEDRGLTLELMNEQGESYARYSPPKKKKPKKEVLPEATKPSDAIDVNKERAWFQSHRKKLAQTGITAPDLSELGPKKGGKPRKVEREAGTGRWSLEKEGDFWESFWQGNPRVRITGLATPKEISLFEQYLGKPTATRLRELNLVIETSRVGRTDMISNIVRSTVITMEKSTEDGREKGMFVEQRRFVPVELNMYFQTKPKGKPKDGIQKYMVGEAKLLVQVFDWDAYLRREDFIYNKIDDGELHYKGVRNLFATQQNLREAVKALLSNYSLGNHAEAGLKLFSRGKGGERDAALKRDIVNAVIGYHPTKEMAKKRRWKNTPLDFQMRDAMPETFTVMKNFRVDRMSKIVAENGEGFRYDHNEAYKRSQANFSPAITRRDNNGNIVPYGAGHIIKDTVYRNKEGEHIAVYALRTPSSEIQVRADRSKVFDYVDEGLADKMEFAIPELRGNQYTSKNGWLHFTPDIHEAGFFEDKQMRVGYIDSQSHIDISDIPFGTDMRTAVDMVSRRIAETTGTPVGKVMEDMLRMKDESGNRIFDSFQRDADALSSSMPTMDEWLMTATSKQLFRDYGIQSVGYMNHNPLSGHEYSTVAILEPRRFVENRQVKGINDFMFQPAKTIADKYREQVKRAGSDDITALLKYKIDDQGNVVPRTKFELQITEKSLTDTINFDRMLVQDALKYLNKEKVFTQETHKRFKEAMTPSMVRVLREKFPDAPLEVVEQIVQYSMDGFASYVQSVGAMETKLIAPFGRETYIPKVSVTADSALFENASKYGITPKTLAETGIPSLGHWVEMSEAEYIALKNYKDWDYTRRKVEKNLQQQAEVEIFETSRLMKGITREEKKLIREPLLNKDNITVRTIESVLRENQGLAGLIDNMAERQKQLVFLADATILGTGRLGDDNLVLSTYAKNKMMKAFMERNIGFAKTLIKTERGYARKDMLEVVNAYEAVVASKRNIAIEADEARAIWDRQTREVDNIISDDAKQRIMDFLSAYHIKDINPEVLDKIRAKLYDESAKGFIELGTPEAIARSVELYAFYDSGGKESLAKIRESIKRNYIESINRLEKEGFYGVRWRPTDISKTNGVVAVQQGGVVKNVQRAWNFDGTHLTVLETQLAGDTKRTLALYDSEGKILSRTEYKFRVEETDKKTKATVLTDVPQSVINEKVELFLQEATQTVRNKIGTGDIPAQQLIEGPYQEVKGNMKNLILTIAKQARGTSELSSDKFKLFRNGDYFVAQEIHNAEMGYDVGAKIKQLEEQLASGKANATRPITDFERTKLEERLQKVDEILRDNKFGSVERMEQLQAEQALLSEQLDSGVKQSDKLDKKKELTIDEKVKLRDEITRLKKFQNQDLGFSFVIDKKYGAELVTFQFSSIKERNAELARMATNKGRNSSEAFEKFAESSFKNFNQFINGMRLKEMNRLGALLAEGVHPDSVIPQIKKLMVQLNEVEKQQRGFYRNEKTRINNELRLQGKKPLEESKIIERIKKEMDDIEDASSEAEAMHLAAAVQLYEMKVLDKMKGFTPERIEELMYRISAKSRELDLDQYRMAVPRDGNVVGMITELQRSFIENGNKFAVLQDKWTQMHDGLYGREEDLAGFKNKINFLSKRYLQAKGIKVTSERSFIEAAKLHDFDVVSKFDFNKLRTSRPQGKGVTYGEPSYLVDADNVLGNGNEYYRTIKDYTDEFKARLINLKNYYDAGVTQGDISIKNILGIELTPANTDISIHHHLRNKLTSKNLGEEAFRWANEPRNRDFIKKLDNDIMEGRIDHNDAVQMIKDEELLSSLGKDGIALKDTVKALDETVEKIAIVSNRLNLAHRGIELVDMNTDIQSEFPFFRKYRAEIPKDIPKLEAELKKLRGQKEALKSRYEKILKKAGDENAPPEFKRLVAEYRQLDYQETIARKNTKQDRQRLREIEKLRKSSITRLFRQYDDFAKNLGLKNIKDSRIEINPADPQTQYIAYAFPEISSDLFQSSWRQWDLSTSYTEGSHNAGMVSGGDAPSSTIGGEQRNFVRQDARNSKRPVFLADYIHFAHAKRAYHERNPSMPMSAADAHLIKFFFPRESSNGLLADKINRVPEEKMKQHEAFTNGIMDNLKTSTEKERFIRSFVVDALDLITDNAGIREVALKKLKQMSDAEYKQWREENPDAVDRSLNTVEVLEQAMYLLKNGVVDVGVKGEKFNFRDSIHTTLTKDDIARIYAIAEKKGWSEEQVQKYIDAGISDVTPKELRPILARKKSPFATRSDIGHIPIDTLVRMQGFMDVWKQEVARHTEDSLFGIERNFAIKQMYENLPPQERFNLDMPTITQMMKDNERTNIVAAREIKKRYKEKNKAILDEASLEQFSFGESDTIIKDEWARVNHILAEALSTEASLIKYKRDAQGFISTRSFALDNLLSMKDNLRITDLRKNKDLSSTIDWANPNKPNFRDTIDGRYFVKREVTKDKKGKTGERFTIFFKGERFTTPSGQVVHEIPTTRFASTDNLTEAQVMIRFFEDDVMRVKRAADMIDGGKTKFDEFRVGEQSLPAQDPRQGLLINWSNAGLFSEQVLNLYMENKGKPFFRQIMADKLEGIGQYGEKGYLVWDANGRTRTKSMLITPQKEGIISKYFEQRRSKDGHQLWVRRKSDKPVVDPNAVTEDNATTQGQALKSDEARTQSPEEKTVSDVSNFDIIQSSGPSPDKPFDDWVIVRNRLKYTIIKIDDKGRSIFRIFNPASVFMAETYHDYEAVEEILKQEMKQYE